MIVSPVPHAAAMELGAARPRAVAIAATGAVAVFGSVAIQGAHGDLLAGQLVQGSLRQATERLRSGRWLVLSQGVAEEHHLGIGQAFTLPTPAPRKPRVASLSTNSVLLEPPPRSRFSQSPATSPRRSLPPSPCKTEQA